jgi:Tfp pilus assembly protein PilF
MARNLYQSGQTKESLQLSDSTLWNDSTDYSAAATLYREAVKLDPTNALYQNALGKALINDYEQKYKEWDRRRIDEEYRVGQINQAETQKWLRGRPVYVPPIRPGDPPQTINIPSGPPPQMAQPLVDFNKPALPFDAMEALREAVRLEPENATYRAELIDAWYKYGPGPDSGSKTVNSSLSRSATDEDIWLSPKPIVEPMKIDRETDVREVLKLEPNNPKLHVVLAAVLAGREKWADAEAEYREAIRLEPQNVLHHTRLAELFSRQQKWAEAESAYRQAVLMAPQDKALKKSLDQAIKNRKKYRQ